MKKLDRHTINTILFVLWMVSSVTDGLIRLPVFDYKLQVFELLFIFFSVTNAKAIMTFLRSTFLLKWTLLVYVGLILLNVVLHFNSIVVLENLGSLYTCLIPIVVCVVLQKPDVGRVSLYQGWKWMTLVVIVSALIGGLASWIGWNHDLVKIYQDYPYFGTVTRLSGLTDSPNKVVFFCACCIYYWMFSKHQTKPIVKWGVIGLLALVAFLTFAKEIIILVLVPFIGWTIIKNRIAGLFVLLSSMLIVITFSFFYFSKNQIPQARTDVVSNESVAGFSNVLVYPTTYHFLYTGAIKMIKERPFTGVGFGNFPKEIEKMRLNGDYPNAFTTYEPHDNYWGLTAQYGIGYILFIVLMIASCLQMVKKSGVHRLLLVHIFIFILLFGLIYFSYHMRFMWMMFGIALFLSESSRKS